MPIVQSSRRMSAVASLVSVIVDISSQYAGPANKSTVRPIIATTPKAIAFFGALATQYTRTAANPRNPPLEKLTTIAPEKTTTQIASKALATRRLSVKIEKYAKGIAIAIIAAT